MMDEMSISSDDSFLSDYSGSDDSDNDSIDDMLEHKFYVALTNQNVIANRLTQTLSHPDIIWRTGDNGLIIEDLSSDDAVSYFRFRKEHLQIISEKLWGGGNCV